MPRNHLGQFSALWDDGNIFDQIQAYVNECATESYQEGREDGNKTAMTLAYADGANALTAEIKTACQRYLDEGRDVYEEPEHLLWVLHALDAAYSNGVSAADKETAKETAELKQRIENMTNVKERLESQTRQYNTAFKVEQETSRQLRHQLDEAELELIALRAYKQATEDAFAAINKIWGEK